MKKVFYYFAVFLLVSFSTGCATIVGGSHYNAIVTVPNHPEAKIEYNGEYKGTGEATFKVLRRDANRFSVTVKEEGCESETTDFTRRTFRGWTLAGTVIFWTGTVGNIVIPWGVFIDASTGAWWKPNVKEKGVSKQNHNLFIYRIYYEGCSSDKE